MEVADAGFVSPRLKSGIYSSDTEQFSLGEDLGLQVETDIHKKRA